jgi:hypothetical protein
MNWRKILKERDPDYDPSDDTWKKRTEGTPNRPPKEWKFKENFGEIQDADIANWFQTIQQKFDEMLSNISIGEVESLDMTTGEMERDVYDTYNKKKIKTVGIDIAADILFAAVEGYMKTLENKLPKGDIDDYDDTPDNVDGVYGSHEYQALWEKTYQFIETLMSAVFDDCYVTIRQMHDDPADVSQMTQFPLNPNEALPDEFIELADEYIETEEEELPQILEDLEKALTGVLTDANLKPSEEGMAGPKLSEEVASAIAENIKKVFQTPEVRDNMKQFKAYVLFSFMVKYPVILETLAASKVADQPEPVGEQAGVEPAEGYTTQFERDPSRQQPKDFPMDIDPKLFSEEEEEEEDLTPTEQAEKRRREFEDKYASANTSPISWMDVLKNTGPTLTSSQGFAPAMHNLRYSEPCACGELTKKQCDCGE